MGVFNFTVVSCQFATDGLCPTHRYFQTHSIFPPYLINLVCGMDRNKKRKAGNLLFGIICLLSIFPPIDSPLFFLPYHVVTFPTESFYSCAIFASMTQAYFALILCILSSGFSHFYFLWDLNFVFSKFLSLLMSTKRDSILVLAFRCITSTINFM